MSDTPETDLEDDLSIDCNNPCYNCPVVKESTGAHLTCDFVPAEFARRLERERDEARKDAAMWKANHDNQVELKSIISKRGDLKDRAPRVEKLIAERDQLRKRVAELESALNRLEIEDVAQILRRAVTKIREEQP
jgi:hypothetical protein